MKQKTQLLFILLWAVVCLFKFDIFPDKSVQLYLSFTLITLIISGIVFFKAIRNKGTKNDVSLWLAGCVAWMVYVIANSLFRAETDSYFVAYFVASVLFVVAMILYFKEGHSLTEIYKYLTWLGVLQSVVILLQHLQVLDTGNIYSVTGTFHNPNITAMYIAICSAFYFGKIMEKPRKWLNYLLLGCLLFAVVLTGCRTAYLGVFVIAAVYVSSNPNVQAILKKIKPTVKYLVFGLIFVLFISASLYLYYDKKESADGRLFVWKISMSMVQEKPIMGYGYGFFDKNYNLKQSDYFAKNTATEAEKQNARYVYMPYNDYLENLIYGGLIGLVFYLLFVIIPILYAAKIPDKTAFSILLATAVMGTTNFIFQSVPVWILVLIITAHTMARIDMKQIDIGFTKLMYVLLICTALTFYVSLRHTYGKMMLAIAFENMNNHNSEKAISAFEKGASFAGADGVFYMRYGGFLLRERKVKDAKEQLLIAKKYSSNPDILEGLGFCNFREGNFSEAERYLLLAKYMVPSYFKARHALLQLYTRTEQLEKALALANETLALPFSENNRYALRARDLALSLKEQHIPMSMEKKTW